MVNRAEGHKQQALLDPSVEFALVARTNYLEGKLPVELPGATTEGRASRLGILDLS